jgi:hypothetical protein
MSICQAIQVLGLPLYYISRHVASTFKRLATTTTRCDLNNFYQNRQGKPPGHDTAHDPVHYPYRKSLDFYRPYLAERLMR